MVWPALDNLPVSAQQDDGIDGVQAGIEHPVMSAAEISEVVGMIVARPMIEMSNHEAGFDLQPANHAATKGVGGSGNSSGFPLSAIQ